MSSFEYVSVLLSIVLALGVAHILSGITAVIQHWRRVERYWVFLAWCVLMLLIHVGFWLNLWRFHDHPKWSAAELLYWFLCTALLFITTRLLAPALPLPSSLREHFSAIRIPFFGGLAAFWLLASTGPVFLDVPWIAPHRPYVVAYTLLSVSGAVAASHRYQATLVVLWGCLYFANFLFFQGSIS